MMSSMAGGSLEASSKRFQFGVYGGIGESFDSDVSLSQGGLSITHKDVEWHGDSFGPAPYWGCSCYLLASEYAKLGLYDRLYSCEDEGRFIWSCGWNFR